MRAFILTCGRLGAAATLLPILAASREFEIVGVVLNKRVLSRAERQRSRIRILRKTLAIGPVGALNGIRMRSWYGNAAVRLGARPIDQQARELGIPMVEVENHRDPRLAEFVTSSRCDIGLSLGNGYIPKSVFSLSPMGMLNIHHEVLPDFRGAQSVIWQLHEGSSATGFTIHRINAGIDTGPVVVVERVPITFGRSLEETVSVTYADLIQKSGTALAHVLGHPSSIEAATVQQGGRHFTTPTAMQFLRIIRNHARLRARALGSDADVVSPS